MQERSGSFQVYVITINNKLKDVRGIQGYEEAVSNLSNSFDQLTGALVAPFFEDIKKGINGLASLFNELTTSVSLFYDKFKSIGELILNVFLPSLITAGHIPACGPKKSKGLTSLNILTGLENFSSLTFVILSFVISGTDAQ